MICKESLLNLLHTICLFFSLSIHGCMLIVSECLDCFRPESLSLQAVERLDCRTEEGGRVIVCTFGIYHVKRGEEGCTGG